MDKFMKIAVMLTAVDQMSSVVNSAVNKSINGFKQMEAASKAALMFGAGKKGFDNINNAVDVSGDFQEASNKLKAELMGSDGLYSPKLMAQIEDQAQVLSAKYANSATAYLDMYRVLKTNRINPEDALGGIGKSVGMLADYFDQMRPDTIAEFAARMRNDLGVGVKDMGQMMDMVARIKGAGVGKTGAEAVEEMNQFFSKVGLGMANLHIQGVQAGKEMAALGALFMNRGLSGQTVGTNFRRIFDGLRDPARMGKVNAIADAYGKHLEFFDKEHKFLGIQNFVNELGKLQGLKPDAIAAILSPFSGKQGLSTDFLEFLANDGTKGMAELNAKLNNQASLTQKLDVIMGGYNYNTKVFKTNWENVKIAFGTTVLPLFNKALDILNRLLVKLRDFMNTHPILTKTIGYIALLGSTFLMAAGAFKGISAFITFTGILKGMIPLLISAASTMTFTVIPAIYSAVTATWSWATALWASGIAEIILIITGVLIGLAAAIDFAIENWDEIKATMYGILNVVATLSSAFYNLGKIMYGALTLDPKMIAEGYTNAVKAITNLTESGGISRLFNEGYDGSMAKSNAERLATPASNTKPVFAPSINLYGGATQEQAGMVSAAVQKSMDQWWKEKQHQINRTGFR